MNSVNKIFGSYAKSVTEKSEKIYRETAKNYYASKLDSIECYRNARNIYNE